MKKLFIIGISLCLLSCTSNTNSTQTCCKDSTKCSKICKDSTKSVKIDTTKK